MANCGMCKFKKADRKVKLGGLCKAPIKLSDGKYVPGSGFPVRDSDGACPAFAPTKKEN